MVYDLGSNFFLVLRHAWCQNKTWLAWLQIALKLTRSTFWATDISSEAKGNLKQHYWSSRVLGLIKEWESLFMVATVTVYKTVMDWLQKLSNTVHLSWISLIMYTLCNRVQLQTILSTTMHVWTFTVGATTPAARYYSSSPGLKGQPARLDQFRLSLTQDHPTLPTLPEIYDSCSACQVVHAVTLVDHENLGSHPIFPKFEPWIRTCLFQGQPDYYLWNCT